MRPATSTLAALGLASLFGCAAPSGSPPFSLEGTTLVDLTHPFTPETLYWPTSPTGFSLEQLAYGNTPGGWFYSSYAFAAPEHGGTHLDAPIHFARGKRTTDQIPLEQLIAPAVVIDIRAKVAADPDAVLEPAEIAAFEREHGAIPSGALVLLLTGWDQHWGDRKAYFGDDTPGDASHLHFPGFGADAARILVEQRGVGGLGVDTPSIDHGPSADFMVHRILMERDGIGLENLTGLDRLPATGATIFALPMKIQGGSGAPLRAVAVVPAAR